MSDSVLMPALGESVTEGTVTRWLKQVGDQVEVDEPLLEVSTDKVDTEIPSPFAGTLTEILVGEDETVEVGTALARIGAAGEGSGDGAGSHEAGGQADGSGADEGSAGAGGGEDAPTDTAAGADEQQAAQIPPEVTGEASTGGAEGGAGGDQPSQGGSGGDTQDITMPALGESVTEGTVTRWLKQVGDQVEVDEALLEVSTDKVDTEIPSPFAGTLTEIVAAEDETVAVGAVLARIGSGGQQSGGQQSGGQQSGGQQSGGQQSGGHEQQQAQSEPAPATDGGSGDDAVGQDEASQQPAPLGAAQPDEVVEEDRLRGTTASVREAPAAEQEEVSAPEPSAAAAENPAPGQQADRESQVSSPAPAQSSQRSGGGAASGYLTPLVRKLAGEKGVDLSEITGTGVGGRIRKEDVLEAAAAAERRREQERAERERAEQQRAAQQSAQPSAPAGAGGRSGDRPATGAASPLRGTTEKASRLRQIIASRMVESLQSMAQLTTVVEVDVTRVVRLRARAKNDFAAREGVNLTFLPFFVLAATEALKEHPKVNGILEGNQITYHGEENVGIAVDTARGLVVPVIRGAGDLNLAGIARKIADLAARTRDNKVTPDELSGATFTVTNTGSGGALFDTPIVPAGTSAILGTGAIVKRPMVATDPDGGEYIAIRSMCYLALSYDHRLVDGADASRYLATVKKRIEEGDFESEVGL